MINLLSGVGNILKESKSLITGFSGDKEEREKREHSRLMGELEHKKLNFSTFLYQLTALCFVGLFLILILSPLLGRVSFLQGILKEYLAIYEGIGEGVIMIVLGSILGIGELGKMSEKRSLSKVVVKQIEAKERIEKQLILTTGEQQTFQAILQKTLHHEGGYVHDKDDRGGETYRGVSRKFHPKWSGWKTIDTLKKNKSAFPKNLSSHLSLQASVEDFYKNTFWLPLKCHKISSFEVRMELFDTAVNVGQKQAVKFLQRAINHCSYGLLKDKLADDGRLGVSTFDALEVLLPRYQKALRKSMDGEQYEFYKKICLRRPINWKFFRTWVGTRLG